MNFAIRLTGLVLALLSLAPATAQIGVQLNFAPDIDKPLDDRQAIATLADTATLRTYVGLVTHVADEDKKYEFISALRWVEVVAGRTLTETEVDAMVANNGYRTTDENTTYSISKQTDTTYLFAGSDGYRYTIMLPRGGNHQGGGADGYSPQISIAEVVTGAPGTPAVFEDLDGGPDVSLRVVIPAGADGQKGDPGVAGPKGDRGEAGEPGTGNGGPVEWDEILNIPFTVGDGGISTDGGKSTLQLPTQTENYTGKTSNDSWLRIEIENYPGNFISFEIEKLQFRSGTNDFQRYTIAGNYSGVEWREFTVITEGSDNAKVEYIATSENNHPVVYLKDGRMLFSRYLVKNIGLIARADKILNFICSTVDSAPGLVRNAAPFAVPISKLTYAGNLSDSDWLRVDIGSPDGAPMTIDVTNLYNISFGSSDRVTITGTPRSSGWRNTSAVGIYEEYRGQEYAMAVEGGRAVIYYRSNLAQYARAYVSEFRHPIKPLASVVDFGLSWVSDLPPGVNAADVSLPAANTDPLRDELTDDITAAEQRANAYADALPGYDDANIRDSIILVEQRAKDYADALPQYDDEDLRDSILLAEQRANAYTDAKNDGNGIFSGGSNTVPTGTDFVTEDGGAFLLNTTFSDGWRAITQGLKPPSGNDKIEFAQYLNSAGGGEGVAIQAIDQYGEMVVNTSFMGYKRPSIGITGWSFSSSTGGLTYRLPNREGFMDMPSDLPTTDGSSWTSNIDGSGQWSVGETSGAGNQGPPGQDGEDGSDAPADGNGIYSGSGVLPAAIQITSTGGGLAYGDFGLEKIFSLESPAGESAIKMTMDVDPDDANKVSGQIDVSSFSGTTFIRPNGVEIRTPDGKRATLSQRESGEMYVGNGGGVNDGVDLLSDRPASPSYAVYQPDGTVGYVQNAPSPPTSGGASFVDRLTSDLFESSADWTTGLSVSGLPVGLYKATFTILHTSEMQARINATNYDDASSLVMVNELAVQLANTSFGLDYREGQSGIAPTFKIIPTIFEITADGGSVEFQFKSETGAILRNRSTVVVKKIN